MNSKIIGVINSGIVLLYSYGGYKLGQEIFNTKTELKDLDFRLLSNIISK